MIFPFRGQWPLTQDWGNKLIINGVDIYGQFGLKGHNGTDWGTQTGTAIIAPHPGKIIECALDRTGYGNYVKIECDKWGSILGHLREWIVKVGDTVLEGQTIGYSNNTGNSTGPHLHWGLYPIPRDRNNGYSGTVDPFQYIGGTMQDDEITIKKSVFEELVGKATKYDAYKALAYGEPAEIKQLIEDLSKSIKDKNELIAISEKKFDDLQREHKNLISDITTEDALNCTQDYSTIKAEARKTGKYKADAEDLSRAFASYKESSEKTHGEMEVEIARLKALLQQQNILENTEVADLLRELIRRLSNILKRK